jgi:uncharacterized oligopeptide transporter (OPT) family protein
LSWLLPSFVYDLQKILPLKWCSSSPLMIISFLVFVIKYFSFSNEFLTINKMIKDDLVWYFCFHYQRNTLHIIHKHMHVFVFPMYNHNKWHINHVLNPKKIIKCEMKLHMICIIIIGIIGFIICKQCFFPQICEVGGLVIIRNRIQSNLAIG